MFLFIGVFLMAVHFILSCLVVGCILWIINKYLDIDARVKEIMTYGAIFLLILDLILEICNII
jgi:hypothetical protein